MHGGGGKYRTDYLKLNDFILKTLPILQHNIKPGVRVETRFSRELARVKADRTQMQMVLSAILANANEAMEDEGRVSISAENREIDENMAKHHAGLQPGAQGFIQKPFSFTQLLEKVGAVLTER